MSQHLTTPTSDTSSRRAIVQLYRRVRMARRTLRHARAKYGSESHATIAATAAENEAWNSLQVMKAVLGT